MTCCFKNKITVGRGLHIWRLWVDPQGGTCCGSKLFSYHWELCVPLHLNNYKLGRHHATLVGWHPGFVVAIGVQCHSEWVIFYISVR